MLRLVVSARSPLPPAVSRVQLHRSRRLVALKVSRRIGQVVDCLRSQWARLGRRLKGGDQHVLRGRLLNAVDDTLASLG